MALNPLLKKLVSQSASKYKSNNSKLSKLKEGRNVIRLIAPKPGETEWVGADGSFFRELGVHWIKKEMEGKPIAVVGSSEICYQQISPLSTIIDMAIASAYDEDSKKLYEEWKARKSIIVNVVNRDANDEVQTLELTPTTFGKVMDLANLYDDNGVDILDNLNGMDIVITKTGKGLNTTYDVAAVPLAPGKTFKPVTGEQVKQAENLDEFIKVNYFRGDEQKAINAIATIAGVKVPALGGPTTPVAALTSSAATVADAPTVDPAAEAAALAAANAAAAKAAADAAALAAVTPAPAPAADDPQAALIAAQAALLAAQQAAEAAATPAPAAVTPETSMSDLPTSEQEALLAELNSI